MVVVTARGVLTAAAVPFSTSRDTSDYSLCLRELAQVEMSHLRSEYRKESCLLLMFVFLETRRCVAAGSPNTMAIAAALSIRDNTISYEYPINHAYRPGKHPRYR